MRVLEGRILVAVKATTTDSLVAEDNSRKGKVTVTGTSEIKIDDDVLFGETFEEIDLGSRRSSTRYYLMEKENVKIIYDGPQGPVSNVLPFLKEKISA